MKLTTDQAMKAVKRMAIMKYFPADIEAREEIAEILISMIEDDKYGTAIAKLEWLVVAMRDNVGEWPGPRELRAVYCCRWKPADGNDPGGCSLPGFTGEGDRAPILGIAPTELPYLPQPGDEPIGDDLMKQIEKTAAAKRMQ